MQKNSGGNIDITSHILSRFSAQAMEWHPQGYKLLSSSWYVRTTQGERTVIIHPGGRDLVDGQIVHQRPQALPST